jgi:aminoglycoside 3-N-acetyltransferase I
VPSDAYLLARLRDETFFAVVAFDASGAAIGGLAAYELKKFEQERSEVYIYDLAVATSHRRKGVATALIRTLGETARRRGAWIMFVQADIGEEDAAANALYRKLSTEMIVAHHYDIVP